jgi:hypothetical protein
MYTPKETQLKTEIIAHLDLIQLSAESLKQRLYYEPNKPDQWLTLTLDIDTMASSTKSASAKLLTLATSTVKP